MTKVTIVPEDIDTPNPRFRASADHKESVGNTPGAALDAMFAQLDPAERATLIVVQNLEGDQFFTQAQQLRMEELLAKWRAARDSGKIFTPGEQAELEALIDAELDASARRASAIASELRK